MIINYREKYPEWLFLRYEDIVMNPKDKFKEIFKYLELEFNEKICFQLEKYISNENPIEAKSSNFSPRNAKASLETWKKRLTSSEIKRVVNQTEDVAKSFYCIKEDGFV